MQPQQLEEQLARQVQQVPHQQQQRPHHPPQQRLVRQDLVQPHRLPLARQMVLADTEYHWAAFTAAIQDMDTQVALDRALGLLRQQEPALPVERPQRPQEVERDSVMAVTRRTVVMA